MESVFTCCIGLSYLNSSQEKYEKEQFSIDLIQSILINTLQEIWSKHSKELLRKAKEMNLPFISCVLRVIFVFAS